MPKLYTPDAEPIVYVVVPCYNEEKRIDLNRFLDFANQQHSLEFVFVNDGSTDGTAELLSDFVKQMPGSCLVDNKVNQGKAEAVRDGVLFAIDYANSNSQESYIAYWDADLATPLDELLRFRDVLQRLPHIDFVLGSRQNLIGHQVHRKKLRGLLGGCFAFVASSILGLSIRDTQCGAKMMRLNEHTKLAFSTPFQSKWIFDVEVYSRIKQLCRARKEPDGLFEIPLETWAEIAGSKLKTSDFLVAIGELFSIAYRYRLTNHWLAEAISNQTNSGLQPSSAAVSPNSTSDDISDNRKAA